MTVVPYCAILDGVYTQRVGLFIIPVTDFNPQNFFSSNTVTGGMSEIENVL
jgi:hypothetical protein